MDLNKYKWLEFINGNNTIIVNSEKEFNIFKRFIHQLGLDEILLDQNDYYDWQHLAKINGHLEDYILFEFNYTKGLTFGSTIEESKKWYETNPLTVNDLQSFFDKTNYIKSEKVYVVTDNAIIDDEEDYMIAGVVTSMKAARKIFEDRIKQAKIDCGYDEDENDWYIYKTDNYFSIYLDGEYNSNNICIEINEFDISKSVDNEEEKCL